MPWMLTKYWKYLGLVFRVARLRLKSPSRYSERHELPPELDEAFKHLRSVVNTPKTKQQEIEISKLLYEATADIIAEAENHVSRQNRVEANSEISVPRAAETILWFLTPRAVREALLGDMEEEYRKCAKKYGLNAAKRDYWWQVVKTCVSLLLALVQRITFIEYILRKLGL